MTSEADLIGGWEERIEALLAGAGLPFDREQPGFSPGGPRWYVEVESETTEGHLMIVTLDDGRANGGRATLSICRQAYLLHDDHSVDDVFGLLARAALFENIGLVGAKASDGQRMLMIQRKVPLRTLHEDEVLPLIHDVIGQFEKVLTPGAPAKIDG